MYYDIFIYNIGYDTQGVCVHANCSLYRCKFKGIFLGTFRTLEEAQLAYDSKALATFGAEIFEQRFKTNFTYEQYQDKMAALNGVISPYYKKNKTSQFNGVSWCPRDNNWTSSFWINKIQYIVGVFDDEFEAARIRGIKKSEFIKQVKAGGDPQFLASHKLVATKASTTGVPMSTDLVKEELKIYLATMHEKK